MASRTAVLVRLGREHAHMLSGSAWLLAGTLTLAAGSFAFWLLVAQQAPADELGRAAALFSATLFVSYLTSLGLPIAVIRYAPDRTQDSATLFAWSLAFTAASSLVGVAALAALAPGTIRETLDAWQPGLAWLVVFLLVGGQSISVLVDARLMALRRWSLVYLRCLIIAAVRLPLVLWVPDSGSALYVYLVAMSPFAITGIAFLAPLARRNWLRLWPLPERARRAAQFAGVNYLGQLAVQGPFFTVPVVVLVQVNAVQNAHFYLSWGVMSIVYVSVQMIAQALLVEGGRGGLDYRRQATVALGAGLTVASAATVLSLALGPVLARLYGPSYGPVATLLSILVAGTIPLAVTMTLLTAARIREHSSSTMAVAAGFTVAVLIPTVLLTARYDALGAAWGWTIGNVIAALVAIFVSRLHLRGDEDQPRPDAVPVPLATIAELDRVGPRG